MAVLAVSSLLARSIIHSSCKLYVFIIDFNVRTICERSFSHCGSRGWMSFIPVTRSLLPHDLRLLSCNKSHLYIDLIIFRVRAGPHPKRWTIWVLRGWVCVAVTSRHGRRMCVVSVCACSSRVHGASPANAIVSASRRRRAACGVTAVRCTIV